MHMYTVHGAAKLPSARAGTRVALIRMLSCAALRYAAPQDDKIIAVHADDPEYKGYSDISQLPPHRLAEIRRWGGAAGRGQAGEREKGTDGGKGEMRCGVEPGKGRFVQALCAPLGCGAAACRFHAEPVTHGPRLPPFPA